MNELNSEEKTIIQRWRELGKFGELKIRKENGVLFEVDTTKRERPQIAKKEKP